MFGPDVLKLDVAQEVEKIAVRIKEQVLGQMRRRGAVLGVSGGIDSSTVAALCARALGAERVLTICMPERDSSDDALRLGKLLAASLDVPVIVEEIAPALQGIGCYARQDDAIRQVFPDYGPGWKCKITLPSILESDRFNVSQLTVEDPTGRQTTARMPAAAYLQLVAATNYKQRIRKMTEYYHADRLNYAVAGTPNRLEYDQGFFVKLGDGAADFKPIAHLYKTFFVKLGDGAADFKPIAHLYKTQVFAVAEFLGVPEEILQRTPTTDTFSIPQTQEEFYFALPYDKMDLCLYGLNHDVPAEEVGAAMGLTGEQVGRVYRDIRSKRRVAHYLHLAPQLVEPVEQG
jgi:NAD+ synthase